MSSFWPDGRHVIADQVFTHLYARTLATAPAARMSPAS
jgi:hypothetical protein